MAPLTVKRKKYDVTRERKLFSEIFQLETLGVHKLNLWHACHALAVDGQTDYSNPRVHARRALTSIYHLERESMDITRPFIHSWPNNCKHAAHYACIAVHLYRE